ncbi:hypothetical protein EV356DRAFT_457935, partial [Viridothelium virens]
DLYKGTNLWCGNIIKVLNNTHPGIHLLYWVWDWPSYKYGVWKPEIYTMCINIKITE